MDIKSLPQDVRSQLRSGANINSISQCVTELVLNSLDVKSTAIAIRVNLLTFRIQVVDNGRGVTKSNMNLIGIRYMTSKCQSLADLKKIKRFGFRGEALASIRNISKKINITSRPDNVEKTYSKTCEHGKWNPVELVKERPSKGTTVTVEGFMYNLPVRQKRIDQNLDMNEIKRMLEGLVIIHPNVSFNLRNDATGKVVFQSNKTRTVSEALINLYPDILIEDLLEIKITKTKISVSGLICKNTSTNKLQFVYLNKRPIIAPKIQKLVNNLLLKSLIYQKPGNFISNEKTEHPIYVLNIKCPYSEIDLTLSPSKKTIEFKQWDAVLKCVEKAVVKLLEHENLIDVNSSKHEVDQSAAPSFKSQFGVSQINGAVKSVPVKRKIIQNRTELNKKRLKDTKICNIPTTEEDVNFGDHVQGLTVAEVHKEPKIGQGRKFKGLSLKKNCKKKLLPIIDDPKDLTNKTTKRETGFKVLPGITKYYKNKNVKGRPTLIGNQQSSITDKIIEEECDDIFNNPKQDLQIKPCANQSQTIYPTVFDKHKNTQSLVLNSELNATKSLPNPLLNSTINTNVLENQIKGKELIMDIFLKSTAVFPNEESPVKDLPVKTTKENLLKECRNQNTTMMTMSWKYMSKKTIVTNSVHPVCKESVSKSDQSNEDPKIKSVQNSTKPKKCKDKMVSKCIQTTMIEHQKSFKIDFNRPETNPKLFNSDPQEDPYNVTFSKYFGKSVKREQNKLKEKYYFPTHFRNNFQSLDNPRNFGIGTNFDFNLNEDYYWKHKHLNNIQIPNFGTNEYLNRPKPFRNHHFRNNGFPTYNRNHDHYHKTFIPHNNERFSCYDGKKFRKPIKKYFSDYNFDFSNLNVYDEPYQEFVEQRNNPERFFPFGKRTNQFFANEQENRYHNIQNDYHYPDDTVPLYQCYNQMGPRQAKPMDNYWQEELQHPNRNKIERHLRPRKFGENCMFNNNFCNQYQVGNDNGLDGEFYECRNRDYGVQTNFQTISDKRMNAQEKEGKKVPKLKKYRTIPQFNKNLYLQPFGNKSSMLKEQFHGPETNIAQANAKQKCYSPFFQNPTKRDKNLTKQYTHGTYQNKKNLEYDNKENRKSFGTNHNLFPDISCVSPFFRKNSEDIPSKTPVYHKFQFVPIKEVSRDNMIGEPIRIPNSPKTDEQLDFTIVIPSNEGIMAPEQQFSNNQTFLFETPTKQFFQPKQMRCNPSEEEEENQLQKSKLDQGIQDYGNLFDGQLKKKEKENNSIFFLNPEKYPEKPRNDFLFRKPQTRQIISSHQNSKLKKFNTEPVKINSKIISNANPCIPQTNFNFQLNSNPSFRKFFTEPNFYNEVPKPYSLDQKSSSESKQEIDFKLTPNYIKEFSFLTPNINKSSTMDCSIEKITLDDSENFNQSSLYEMEHQKDLTVCSKNFNPLLSSTQNNNFDESIQLINSETKQSENSEVIQGTPIEKNFFVPSFNQPKVKKSLLNISMDKIKQQTSEQLVNSENYKTQGLNFSVEYQNKNDLENMETEEEWIQKVNTFGQLFYIHKRTGMPSMHKPQQDTHFNLIKRIDFVPKGLSPIFIETKKIDASLSPTSKKSLHAAILENYENELKTIKWSNYIYDHNDAKMFFEELYREKTKKFESHIPNTNLNEFPKSMVKLYNNMKAQSFTKDIFSGLKIIGQLDNKFIVAIIKDKQLIVLFDQHAVHERVRLEQLLKDYKETTNDTDDDVKFKSTKCNEKITVPIATSDLNILSNYKNLFENLGFAYAIFANSIEITHIPTCLYNKFVGNKEKDKSPLRDNINSLLLEQIAMVTSTRGVSSKTPNTLQNIINSEACRGAVKFGDKLTRSECEHYLRELSLCQLPFQCAHGRPTLAPIINLNNSFDRMKPNLQKLKK